MQFRLDNEGRYLISHYGEGVIAVNGTEFRSNLLITPDAVIDEWYSGAIRSLDIDAFAPLLERPPAERPEVVLLGTGARHVFPPPALFVAIREAGMALEVMGTRAACRTHAVLVSEDRQVAAALVQIESVGRASSGEAGGRTARFREDDQAKKRLSAE